MPKVKLTITDSSCRSGYFKKGQEYIVEDLCPHYAMNYGIASIRWYIVYHLTTFFDCFVLYSNQHYRKEYNYEYTKVFNTYN